MISTIAKSVNQGSTRLPTYQIVSLVIQICQTHSLLLTFSFQVMMMMIYMQWNMAKNPVTAKKANFLLASVPAPVIPAEKRALSRGSSFRLCFFSAHVLQIGGSPARQLG